MKTQAHKGTPCEGEGREWSVSTISQETPGLPETRRGKEGSSPTGGSGGIVALSPPFKKYIFY